MLFIDGKCFRFYPSENAVNGNVYIGYNLNVKIHMINGSQPIICFLILDCNK